jgi:phosphatidylglycerophosphatase A
MIKKNKPTDDVTDAIIVAETHSEHIPQADAHSDSASRSAPETLKPMPDSAAQAKVQAANEASTVQEKLQAAAAAAVLGAAYKAVNNALQPRPNWAFATQSSAHLIALGFGSGLLRPAPGTWGTAFGWVTFNVMLAHLSNTAQGVVIALAFVIGVWACGAAGKALGVVDHGAWVWDEVVAFWLVLWLIPPTFGVQLWAFVLFRFFDIVKPPPIRQWDARLKSGFGVMWDDVVAAFYTLLLISVYLRLLG